MLSCTSTVWSGTMITSRRSSVLGPEVLRIYDTRRHGQSAQTLSSSISEDGSSPSSRHDHTSNESGGRVVIDASNRVRDILGPNNRSKPTGHQPIVIHKLSPAAVLTFHL